MTEKKPEPETREEGEGRKPATKREKIVYYAILGLFLLIIGFLIFASLQ